MRNISPQPDTGRLRGLYAVTSEAICRSPDRLIAAAEEALSGGARLLQYRDKWNSRQQRERNAHALLGLCHAHAVRLIINDDPELAIDVGADGVHVGASDTPLARARELLGPDAIIGVSCAGSLERARAAQAGGASYVAFGRFFDSRTKPDAPPAALSLLGLARQQLQIPVCAIGGITPQLAPQVLLAGAELIAAVDGVFGAASIEAAAREYSRLFD
jgi:thiamine-phosphate pyrophosphorylase